MFRNLSVWEQQQSSKFYLMKLGEELIFKNVVIIHFENYYSFHFRNGDSHDIHLT